MGNVRLTGDEAVGHTVAGRQQNRRVEIAIIANDKLRKAAENGELG